MEYSPVACMRQSSRWLNLLAAIVIYWNTAHLGEAVRQRKHADLTVQPELLAHISPLEWAHCPASTIFAGWRQLVLPVHLLDLDALLGSVAIRPSYMCKSEPQIQEEVIFTMPSLGCCSSGSGTFSAAILNGAW